MMPKPLASRLSLVLLLGFALIALTSGVLLYVLVRNGLTEAFDRELLTKARGISSLLENHGRYVEFDFRDEAYPEFSRADGTEYFQIWLDNGQLVEKSNRLSSDHSLLKSEAWRDDQSQDLLLPDGRTGRGVAFSGPILPPDDDEADEEEEGVLRIAPHEPSIGERHVIVVVAKDRSSLNASLRIVGTALVASFAAMALGLVILVRCALRRGLQPLTGLENQAQALTAKHLDVRLDESSKVSEIASLTSSLNGLLARLQRAFERERRMTANLAHEIRTPLSELQSAAEVALAWPDDHEAQANFLKTGSSVSSRLNRMVASLLHLARLESGEEALVIESFALSPLMEAAWEDLRQSADFKAVSIERVGEGTLEGSKDLTRMLVAILLQNVVQHAIPSSTVTSILRSTDESTMWELTNQAHNLESLATHRLTEPFWCHDSARSNSQHLGLGLSIADVIAEHLRAQLEFEISPPRFIARVRFANSFG